MRDDCIFCKIADGRIPSERILKTPDVQAFLDIGPIVKGHVLVIPREHYERVVDLPPGLLNKVIDAVHRVSGAWLHVLKADGVNLFKANGAAAGQVVPHVHFHVIPRFNNDGHHWNWASGTYDAPDEIVRTGERLRTALR